MTYSQNISSMRPCTIPHDHEQPHASMNDPASMDYKDSAGACNWEDKHEHKLHTIEDHQEGERLLTNNDTKDNLDTLVSDNHLPGHSNSLTERRLRAEDAYLGTIVSVAVMSTFTPWRASIVDKMVTVTICVEANQDHVTMCYNTKNL